MSPEEAGKIISKYGEAITKLKAGCIVQPITDLPCSPAKIKYAHFVYVEASVRDNSLTKEAAENLKSTYAMVNTRFRENADEINKAYKAFQSGDNEALKVITENGGLSSFIPSGEGMVEFHNFIADCQGNWR